MGQQITTTTANTPTNATRSTKKKLGFAKALVDPSILSPAQLLPGDLPEETLVFIFSFLDLRSFYSCAITCKSWFEAALKSYQNQYLIRYLPPPDLDKVHDWKALYNKQKKIEENIINGRYWAEAIASNYYFGVEFVYSASYYNDKLIYNIAASEETRLGNTSKHSMVAYHLDLNSMARMRIEQYGQEFANDRYKILGDTHTKWWFVDYATIKVYDNNGKEILRKIERSEKEASFGSYYLIKPNLDGSDEVLTHEKSSYIQEKDTLKHKKFNVEIFDLNTGNHIYRQKIGAMDILAYYDNLVFLLTKKGVEVYDLDQQQVRVTLGSDSTTIIKINDDKLAVADKNVITFYDLRSFTELNSITIEIEEKERIFAIGFDRWKLVIGIIIRGGHGRYEIYALDSKKLLQRLINTSDHSDDNLIHLPSNGKIVTDCRNLTVYDFYDHPNVNKKITVLFHNDNKWYKHEIKAKNLTQFCEEKLGQLSQLCHRTFYLKYKHGKRMTTIFNMKNGHASAKLQEIFDQMKVFVHEENRNTFQLISNDKKWTKENFVGWENINLYYTPCILVFERFKRDSTSWELCSNDSLMDKIIENSQ